MVNLLSGLLALSFVGLTLAARPQADTGTEVEFDVKEFSKDPLYETGNRIEHAERNTSASYGWWKIMNILWIEWPGNITKLEPEYPLLKWSKRHERAKLIQNPCSYLLGMEFRAYAYKFLHLTWGAYRLQASYCPPMKVPREKLQGLPSSSTSPYISVSDFEFVEDALLVIIEDKFILRIGGLEGAWLDEGTLAAYNIYTLSYSISTGITEPITKLETQNCCRKRSPTCIYGETVLAYNERSDFKLFISTDGGLNFRKLQLTMPSDISSSIFHTAILFPNIQSILVIHGNETAVQLDAFNAWSGNPVGLAPPGNADSKNASKPLLNVNGFVQTKQLGEEFSVVIWDECRVWYSSNAGLSVSEGLFYIHHNIVKGFRNETEAKPKSKKGKKKHSIRSTHCHLGKASALTYDNTGKVGLLDADNNFFYGIDTKGKKFPIVGTNMDMTLLLKGKEKSIVPYFDFNSRPKLMYPPRYLVCEDEVVHEKNYPKRLGMRLLPRSVFPSDFIPPYFEENIPKQYIRYGLSKCQTSSLSVDSSISQKPKIYTTSEQKPFEFIVEFKSRRNSTQQLNVEPKYNLKFLKISLNQLSFMKLGLDEKYYFKYKVVVLPKSGVMAGNLYRMNFYTEKSIRCVHQPQITIWIKIEESKGRADEGDYEPGIDVDTPEMSAFFFKLSEIKAKKEENPTEIHHCENTNPAVKFDPRKLKRH